MITPRNSLWIIPLFLIITFPLWKIPAASFLAPRGGFDPEFSHKGEPEHNFTMLGVNILQNENGLKNVDIRASEAASSKIPNQFTLKDVTADILSEDGKPIHVVGDIGSYDTVRKRLKLTHNVVITSVSDNFTMETEIFYYFDIEQKIHCPEETLFHGDGIFIKGSSFDYDIKDGMYIVGGRVFSTVKAQNSP